MSNTGFYNDKPADLPRRSYRALQSDLVSESAVEKRATIIDEFINKLRANHGQGEYLKMKLVLPSNLSNILSIEERMKLEDALAKLREKRGSKLHGIFPLCADEFKFEKDFYTSVFQKAPTPIFNKTSQMFAIGSCFAVNISRHLLAKGYAIEAFRRTESVNSVFGNALLFKLLLASDEDIQAYITQALSLLYADDIVATQAEIEFAFLKDLRDKITSSDVLIVTLGNSIDAFYEIPIGGFDGPKVFPRFLSMFQTESVKLQANISGALKSLGGSFRVAGVLETLPVVKQMFESLRALNPTAHIFATVSPVAIHNTLGISEYSKRGPMEADCATKSILRACMEDVIVSSGIPGLHYFPSFEIVRWLGSTVDMAAFGAQDSASVHVSDEVLKSIYDYFEYLYVGGA